MKSLSVCTAVFVCLAAGSVAAQASAILVHGVPRLSFAEDRMQHLGSYYGYGAYYGMWHPPVYLYTLAAAVRGTFMERPDCGSRLDRF